MQVVLSRPSSSSSNLKMTIICLDDMNWNALEWDRAAEELTWERVRLIYFRFIYFRWWIVILNTSARYPCTCLFHFTEDQTIYHTLKGSPVTPYLTVKANFGKAWYPHVSEKATGGGREMGDKESAVLLLHLLHVPIPNQLFLIYFFIYWKKPCCIGLHIVGVTVSSYTVSSISDLFTCVTFWVQRSFCE